MSTRDRSLSAVLLLCAATGCATAAPAPKPAAPASKRELPQRSELPMVVRETLSASMERHGEELSFLLVSVVLLDYAGAEKLGQQIADEPKLGRPHPSEKDTLNALLPSAFFTHQDRLTERARALSLAAHEKDDAELVKAFGALAETCVGCHAAYLHEELEAGWTAQQ